MPSSYLLKPKKVPSNHFQ
uniref:Uncharacterized protein n=1 Tax=Rhizophora mucronata TaxID=61149 RepID=A0A2P2L772_RHIMU